MGVKREKLYQLDDHVACAVAGITADANILVNTCRLHAQRYTLQYQEPIPVDQLVRALCDTKQGYTQYGGLRPFGVSLLYAGWDEHRGFQLYQSDPSGNYGGWKATSIGANHQAATNVLQGDYAEDVDLERVGQGLAVFYLKEGWLGGSACSQADQSGVETLLPCGAARGEAGAAAHRPGGDARSQDGLASSGSPLGL